MLNRSFGSLVLMAASSMVLTSCQAAQPLMPAHTVPAAAAAQLQPGGVLLEGHVVFPGAHRTLQNDTSALDPGTTQGAIAGSASVTLYDATGTPRAAGLTDAQGAFVLYQGTTPFVATEGAFYRLEVTKRRASSDPGKI